MLALPSPLTQQTPGGKGQDVLRHVVIGGDSRHVRDVIRMDTSCNNFRSQRAIGRRHHSYEIEKKLTQLQDQTQLRCETELRRITPSKISLEYYDQSDVRVCDENVVAERGLAH
ncbi:hypothetical protein Sjap_026050 [Stephania japonica]|uniref:Uncharacterized protein n=1 Tax=Stephania japonica TaxID=461633 RepID=A0AAP0E2W5_9MAGN